MMDDKSKKLSWSLYKIDAVYVRYLTVDEIFDGK